MLLIVLLIHHVKIFWIQQPVPIQSKHPTHPQIANKRPSLLPLFFLPSFFRSYWRASEDVSDLGAIWAQSLSGGVRNTHKTSALAFAAEATQRSTEGTTAQCRINHFCATRKEKKRKEEQIGTRVSLARSHTHPRSRLGRFV